MEVTAAVVVVEVPAVHRVEVVAGAVVVEIDRP